MKFNEVYIALTIGLWENCTVYQPERKEIMTSIRSIPFLLILAILLFSTSCTDYLDIKIAFHNCIYSDISNKLNNLESVLTGYETEINKQGVYYTDMCEVNKKYFAKVQENYDKRSVKRWNYHYGYLVQESDYTCNDALTEISLRNALIEARIKYEWSKLCSVKLQSIKPIVDLFTELKSANLDYNNYIVKKVDEDTYIISAPYLGISSDNISSGQWNYFKGSNSYEPVNIGSTAVYNIIHSINDYNYEYEIFVNANQFDHDLPLVIKVLQL